MMKNKFKIKLFLLFIVIVVCLVLSISFIQMYPFAKGVVEDARKRSNDNNSAHCIMGEKELHNLEHLMLQSLISNDIVAIEIYSEHGKLLKQIEKKENFKIIKNWLNSSYLSKTIASYYTPIYRMDFIYTGQVKKHIKFGGDKEYSTIEYKDILFIADKLPHLISND